MAPMLINSFLSGVLIFVDLYLLRIATTLEHNCAGLIGAESANY